ncbi:MAG: hypothetical protein DMG65_12435 [Candidatus Angelobacter sp. Gp1-AA117]|nr:MAG: hypothetical protein DMG65_12435 [Candidatus Angelobacter sp. Gp1-AA117]
MILYTGNPFVDVGLAIAANIGNQASLSNISSDDLSKAVKFLHSHVDSLKSLKVLSEFWVNNPFMGINPEQKPKYDRFLKDLGDQTLASRSGYCQICGQSPVVGETDRCWFPLAAGGDSDPCTLPGLRGKTICASCLSAVVILPLGCRSCKDGAYFIHVAEPDLQVQAVAEGVTTIRIALAKKAGEGIKHGTALSGRIALLEIISGSDLWDHTQPGHMEQIPRGGATIISFTNRGNGPKFNELHLPAEALEFFSELATVRLREYFAEWVRKVQKFTNDNKRKDIGDQLCNDVEGRRSLAPLFRAMKKPYIDRHPGERAHLQKEELQMLEIYEDIALRKKNRFDALQRIAVRVNEMPQSYRDSFVKRLGSTGTKEGILGLFKEYCKRKRLAVTSEELRAIDSSNASEAISLLYLLCNAEE